MDVGNLFSFNHVALLLLSFVGAFMHYSKGKVMEGSVLGFGQWLMSASPVKSVSVWVLVIAGSALLALAGVWGLVGWGLAFLFGYFSDSILKRLPRKVG